MALVIYIISTNSVTLGLVSSLNNSMLSQVEHESFIILGPGCDNSIQDTHCTQLIQTNKIELK